MVGDSDLLDGEVEEVAEEISDTVGEAVVETGWEEVVAGSDVVGTSVGGDRACFAASGEARDERPDEHRDVEFAVTLDDITLTRDVFDADCWKEGSQSASYDIWGEFGFHNLSLCGRQR